MDSGEAEQARQQAAVVTEAPAPQLPPPKPAVLDEDAEANRIAGELLILQRMGAITDSSDIFFYANLIRTFKATVEDY